MRLILRVVPSMQAALASAIDVAPFLTGRWLQELLGSSSSQCVSAFLSLPEAELLTRAELLDAVEEVLARRSLDLSCPPSCCLLLVHRPSTPLSSSLYAVLNSSDVQCLVKEDELLLLSDASLNPNSSSSPPALLLHLASGYRAAPPLRATRDTKPLSQHARLMRDFDRAQPCQVPRSDVDEPVWEADAVHLHATAVGHSEESRAYAVAFRRALSSNGFVRLRLPPQLQLRVQAMQRMQEDYFRLPSSAKQSHALPRARGLASNYQPPFGYVQNHQCNKEYYVVRQPPATTSSAFPSDGDTRASFALHPQATLTPQKQDSSNVSYALPKQVGVDMGERVWPVFHELGSVCQDLMRLLLSSLDVAPAKVEAACAIRWRQRATRSASATRACWSSSATAQTPPLARPLLVTALLLLSPAASTPTPPSSLSSRAASAVPAWRSSTGG